MKIPIITGVLSLFLFYLLANLAGSKIISGISVNKNSLISKIKKYREATIIASLLLWILAIGNFTFANNWVGTSISKGAEYFEAVALSLISFVISNKKIKMV